MPGAQIEWWNQKPSDLPTLAGLIFGSTPFKVARSTSKYSQFRRIVRQDFLFLGQPVLGLSWRSGNP